MKLLGKAKLYEHRHGTGALVRSYDLTPWGEIPLFVGPVDQPLAEGTVDRGNLRVELQTGNVYLLQPGDPAPSIGKPGAAIPAAGLMIAALVLWNFFRR